MIYKNEFGEITLLGDKQKFEGDIIGIAMSGGADSTLLCYLLAKTIYENNLNYTIQPICGFDISAQEDGKQLPLIIEYISKAFPDVNIKWPITTIFDSKGKDVKNDYISELKFSLYDNYVNIIYSGMTLGPPAEVQKEFNRNKNNIKNIMRLPNYDDETQLVESKNNINILPFKYVDKRFVIKMYYVLDIKDLLKLTQSCVSPAGNCGMCWWCQEREWAEYGM